MSGARKDFTHLLVEKGLVTQEQLETVRELHAKKGGSLSDLLISLGYVDEKDLMVFLSTYLSIPPIKVLNLKIPKEVLNQLPKETVRKYQVLPVGKIGNTLTLAIADPLNVLALEDLERLTKCQISPVIASRSELTQVLDMYYKESLSSAIEEIIQGSEKAAIEIIQEEKEEVKDDEVLRSIDEAPVIKLANYLLKKAVEERASDILIEPMINTSRIRYRIDGVLREAQTFPRKMHTFVVSRLKVIANLDITEHRVPQDGRFRMNVFGNDIDFRVSILPSTMGEKVALRLLDKSSGLLDLNMLGFENDIVDNVQKDSKASYGMVLVTGPTGSGKTTTLYSMLGYIYSSELNIITVEDPIEYQLQGINQVNVNYEVQLTFAAALRSILRQDPDVIMIGEMRDLDTVDIAIKSALTGHLVLSTLHTTTAVGSVTRLVNMGAEPFLLSSTLIGVLAQRLLRKLCPKCREEDPIEENIRDKLHIRKGINVYKPKGCRICDRQGYKGRIAIGEYLHTGAELRAMINASASEHDLKKQARTLGMRTLREDGIIKVEKGDTSLQEVLRATAADES